MKEILNELDALAKARIEELYQAKNNGTPIVEWTGTYIPEEMIRAAGAETYPLFRGGQAEPVDATATLMLRFMNPMAASLFGFNALNMDPITPIADLISIQQTDCHVNRVSEVFELKGYPVNKVGIPSDWTKDIAFDYYENSLRKLVKQVEGITGKPMDEDAAKENFRKSNQINDLLRKIGDLRKRENPPIGFAELLRLHHCSFIIDPDVMIEKLTELYTKLENAPGKFKEKPRRILVAGRAFAIEDYLMPKMLEENGGVIVAELLDEAFRVTECDVDTEGDIIHNFAKNRYLDKTPSNFMQPAWSQKFERMMELYKEYDCEAIIWYQLIFDEIYDMECTCINKWCADAGIPFLKLESGYDYARENTAHLITRLESFIKSL